ncbi:MULTISPECIES: VOC family protein [Paenibacillus]|uniref:VOC family protein n=1 Tax=Paenibacillus TaxID=44249 RepID=UPI0022B913A4|nr:VOC family protein [Paenibacillus caseinilyticus]MCZ8522938.1 VOC family protein [Paenibacillus caseinilyticus]
MRVQWEGITVLSDDVSRLARFYREVLGLAAVVEESHYAEFVNDGIRLAICSKSLMADNTNGHYSFIEERKGQAFELNFQCESPEAVHTIYHEMVSKGAVSVTEPKSMSWGHTTGFFADPDGNIHSLFAINPIAEKEE